MMSAMVDVTPPLPDGAPTTVLQETRSPSASFLLGSLALLSTQPFTWGASVVSIALLPRYLGSRDLGTVSLAASIAQIVGIVATLGISTVIVRGAAAGHQAEHEVSAALNLMVVTSIVLTVVVGVGVTASGVTRTEAALTWLALIGISFTSVASVGLSRILGQERFNTYALAIACVSVTVSLLPLLVLVLGGSLIAASIPGVLVAALLLMASIPLARVRITRGGFDVGAWKRLARAGSPFLAINAVTWIYADGTKILLRALTGSSVLGWQAAAARVAGSIVFLPTLVATPLLPALSRDIDDVAVFSKTLRHAFILVIGLVLPITGLMIAIAPYIPSRLGWSQDFGHAIVLIQIAAIEQPIVAIDIIIGVACIALGKERRLFYNTMIAAASSVALHVVLVPLFQHRYGNGAIGSGVARVATEVILMVLALRLLPKRALGPTMATAGMRILVAALVLTVIAAWVAHRALFAAPIAGGAVYVTLLFVLRVVRPHEATTALASIRRKIGR